MAQHPAEDVAKAIANSEEAEEDGPEMDGLGEEMSTETSSTPDEEVVVTHYHPAYMYAQHRPYFQAPFSPQGQEQPRPPQYHYLPQHAQRQRPLQPGRSSQEPQEDGRPLYKVHDLSRPKLIRNAQPFTLENAAFIFCDFSDLIVAWYYRTHDTDVSSTYWRSKSILDLLRKHNASLADTSKHVQIIHNCVGVSTSFFHARNGALTLKSRRARVIRSITLPRRTTTSFIETLRPI